MSKEYPENKAAETWTKGAVVYSLVFQDRFADHALLGAHYCGYCRLPKNPLREKGCCGIVTYVPVHGGVTYAHESEDGSMVYGFGCGHHDDNTRPHLQDTAWLRGECERLSAALLVAAEYEQRYLSADGNEARADVVDAMHEAMVADHGIEFEFSNNYGAMLGIMCGRV